MKYLFILIFPLSNASNIFATIMIIEPNIFLNTIFSLRNINPNIIKNTVDNCFSILNTEGSNPYLASIFNLSVNAYIIITINNIK